MSEVSDPAPERRDPLVGRGHAHSGGERGREAESGDTRGPSAPRVIPRPSVDAPRAAAWTAPRRLRLGFGIALVAVLAIAWIGFEPRGTPRQRRAVADLPVPTHATTRATTATPRSHAVAVPPWVPPAIAATCRARSAVAPVRVVVDCDPGRGVVRLRYTQYASQAVMRRDYAAAPRAQRAGNGAPACAGGETDERAWSTAARPETTVGRYRCTNAGARATIVWTDDRMHTLATAGRADADLRSLYLWWTTVPGPVASRP